MANASPKYDLRVNPVYQVDWQSTTSGKRISATKRRVCWRFGFSNADAITKGLKGTDCRGEEHEVVLIWSLTSGKRQVLADGHDVHYSQGSFTDSKFETSWTMRGGHTLKIIAFAAPPLFNQPDFRQFDLLLDGCSYFDFPKIFQLGTSQAFKLARRITSNYATPPPRAITSGYDAHDRGVENIQHYNNEGHYTPPRRSQEYVESRRSPDPKGLSHKLATPAGKQNAEIASPTTVVDIISTPTDGLDLLDGAAATATSDAFTPVQDEFTPVPAPSPAFSLVSNQILSAYNPTPALPALANESHTHFHAQQPVYQQLPSTTLPQPMSTQVGFYTPSSHPTHMQQQTYSVTPESGGQTMTYVAPVYDTPTVVTPSMAPMDLKVLEERDSPPMSEMEKAIHALVNLEDIAEVKETPEKAKQKEKKSQNQPNRSKPLPAAQTNWTCGKDAPLAQLKENAVKSAPPAKEIMRTHVFDPQAAQAGMMVVYGQTIPQAPGFGYALQHQHQMVAMHGQPMQYYGNQAYVVQ